MIINDNDFAKEFLKNHEYYRLSGYCHLFIRDDRFIKNITFEEMMAFKHNGFWQCMDTQREVKLLIDLWEKGNAPWKRW